VVELETDRRTVSDARVELRQGRRTAATARAAHVSIKPGRIVLREHRKAPSAGHYELIVRVANQVMARRDMTLR